MSETLEQKIIQSEKKIQSLNLYITHLEDMLIELERKLVELHEREADLVQEIDWGLTDFYCDEELNQ